MDYLHIDIMPTQAMEFGITPIMTGGVTEKSTSVGALTAGEWNSIDLPLADFGFDFSYKMFQLKIDRGTGVETVYVDNIYFWKEASAVVDTEAPVITKAEVTTVSDKKAILTLSATDNSDGNVTFTVLNGTEQVGEWHDMHCRIEGEEVNTLQKIFLRMWKKVTGEEIHGAKYYRYGSEGGYFKGLKPDTTATSGRKMVGIINREPHTSNEIIREFYYNAINFARDSIKIINPYFTPSPRLKRALRKAAERGVKVELMLSVKSDIPLTPDCGFYNAHRLMKRGVKVWMFKPGFHHTKIIMVDGKFCTVGSANLNSRSLRWDYEENAVIVDKHTTKELSDLFERQKKDCFLLTPESWNSFRTRWQKFRGWFANLLSPFL